MKDGSFVRSLDPIVIALFIASCAAPDTRHHIVISTRDQKLAFSIAATSWPLIPSPLRSSVLAILARQQVYAARQFADSGKNWRQCATGHGVQRSAAHRRSRSANSPGRDPIVTRILWLRGLEAQNANAFGRDIYIHGTPEEWKIGSPASYGCVRMRSSDIIQLYNIVGVGAAVTIVNAPLVSAVPGMASGHSMGPENTAPFVMR